MKLSTKGRYGLRALIDIAGHSRVGPVSIGNIAKRQNLSERYLEQLVSLLKKAGLIKSVRGAGGGYILTRDAREISVGQVLRALEGNLEMVECSAFSENPVCGTADQCVTKYVWQRVNEAINQTVDHITIQELVEVSLKLDRTQECS